MFSALLDKRGTSPEETDAYLTRIFRQIRPHAGRLRHRYLPARPRKCQELPGLRNARSIR